MLDKIKSVWNRIKAALSTEKAQKIMSYAGVGIPAAWLTGLAIANIAVYPYFTTFLIVSLPILILVVSALVYLSTRNEWSEGTFYVAAFFNIIWFSTLMFVTINLGIFLLYTLPIIFLTVGTIGLEQELHLEAYYKSREAVVVSE